jgi:hypothetical protein
MSEVVKNSQMQSWCIPAPLIRASLSNNTRYRRYYRDIFTRTDPLTHIVTIRTLTWRFVCKACTSQLKMWVYLYTEKICLLPHSSLILTCYTTLSLHIVNSLPMIHILYTFMHWTHAKVEMDSGNCSRLIFTSFYSTAFRLLSSEIYGGGGEITPIDKYLSVYSKDEPLGFRVQWFFFSIFMAVHPLVLGLGPHELKKCFKK